MCITAATMAIGAGVSAASSIMGGNASAAAAKSEAQWRNYQIALENQQLKEEQEVVKLKAGQVEGNRLQEATKLRAANEAAIAGSGVGENISYDQGIEKTNDRMAREDITTLKLNSADQVAKISNQITINNAEAAFATQKAKMTASAARTAGFMKAAGSLVDGFNSYMGVKH